MTGLELSLQVPAVAAYDRSWHIGAGRWCAAAREDRWCSVESGRGLLGAFGARPLGLGTVGGVMSVASLRFGASTREDSQIGPG